MCRQSLVFWTEMKASVAAILSLFVCVPGAGQIVTQSPVCLSFNAGPGAIPTPTTFCNTGASVTFVAPFAFSTTDVEVFAGVTGYTCISLTNSTNRQSGSACPYAYALYWLTASIAPVQFAAGDV